MEKEGNNANHAYCFGSIDPRRKIVRKEMPLSLPLWVDGELRGHLGVRLSLLPNDLTNHPTRLLSSSFSSRKRLQAMDGSDSSSIHRERNDGKKTLVNSGGHDDEKVLKDNFSTNKMDVDDDSDDGFSLVNESPSANEECGGNAANRKYESDLIVVLDLDECLIHTEPINDHGVLNLPINSENVVPENESNVEWVVLCNGDTSHRIYLRPYVRQFLKSVSSQFETHLFTAGTRSYAKCILQSVLDPNDTIFAYVHARENCTFKADNSDYYKDLRTVFEERKKRFVTTNGVPAQDTSSPSPQATSTSELQAMDYDYTNFLKRVVLVDNLDSNFLCNPSNGIVVCDFYNDHNDMTLLNVLNLLHTLDHSVDVRSVLKGMFQLQAKLSSHARSYWPCDLYLRQIYSTSSSWDWINTKGSCTSSSDQNTSDNSVYIAGSAIKTSPKSTKRRYKWDDVSRFLLKPITLSSSSKSSRPTFARGIRDDLTSPSL